MRFQKHLGWTAIAIAIVWLGSGCAQATGGDTVSSGGSGQNVADRALFAAGDYASNVVFRPFGGSNNTISFDATTSGHNGAASTWKIVVPTSGYTGGALASGTVDSGTYTAAAVDLSAYNALSFWAKASTSGKTMNVGIGNNATSTTYSVEVQNIALNTSWTQYYVPIPVPSKFNAATGLFHFAKGSDATGFNIWIDDVQYTTVGSNVFTNPRPAMAGGSTSMHVGDSSVQITGANVIYNASGTDTTYLLGDTGSGSCAWFTWSSSNTSAATVSATGAVSAVAVGTSDITATLGTTAVNGTQSFTIQAALSVTAPSTVPANPSLASSDVISLFNSSATYTDISMATWQTGWSGSATMSDDTTSVSGKTIKKLVFTSANGYLGAEPSSTLNVTGKSTLHLSYWTANGTALGIKVVDFGADGAYGGGDDVELQVNASSVTQNAWTDLELDYSALTTKAHVAQFVIVGNNGAANQTYYFDNVYFH